MNASLVVSSPAAAAAEPTQVIEWLGLRFAVPEDWQIIRHAVALEAGRLVMVDRRRERCSLIWTHCAERPDLVRLVDDARNRAASERPQATFQSFVSAAAWRGYVETCVSDGSVKTSAVRWDERGKRLLELVIMGRVQDDAPRELAVELVQAVESVARPEAARRWRAFDVDVTTPADYRLVRLDARPADATFLFRRFDPVRGRPTIQEGVVRRMGMADVWHDGDLERLARRLDPDARIETAETHPDGAVTVIGYEGSKRYQRLLGTLRVQRARLWLSPVENAVYAVTTRGRRADSLRPVDFVTRHPEEVT